MTDKSFGDHMNRNIVKNPLLSTAVTGLSLEDLTHNAVLLPVSRSQEVITRSDHQHRPQYRTLGNADNANTTYPPGDSYAKQNPTTMPYQPHPTFPAHGTNQNIAIDNQKLLPTPSKALPRSGDDFDVNEYFARLQGTHRYVSAPLNVLKDDSNANIRSTEENLEEINLNEPDKVTEQHSITADIAQNFSQLPAVLPQVASAVFSSFSNMLSMKSRENTPEEVKPAYQHRSEGTVELMSVPELKDVAPPPKEPPIVGTSNYRLPPKKKYAQIPGLSTGDSVQNPLAQPAVPFGQAPQPPAYFTQSQQLTQEPSRVEDPNRFIASRPPTFFMPIEANLATGDQQELNITADNNRHSANATQNPYDFYNPAAFTATNIPVDIPPYQKANPTSNMPVEFAAPKGQSIEACTTPQAPSTTILTSVPPQSSAAIIPPPPMFSNMMRRDSQSGVGRTILPPSVARRISSNHPVIKQQTTQHALIENIFMPIMSDTEVHDNSNSATNATVTQCDMKPPSAFAPIVSPLVSSPSVFMPSYDTGSTMASVSPAMPPTAPTSVSTGPPVSTYASTSVPSPRVLQPLTLSETAPATLPPTSNLPNVQLPGSTPAMFTPCVPYTQSETSIPPPTIFNPSTATTVGSNQFNPTSILNVSHSITSFPAMNPPLEPPKPVAEPPKATGTVNYRLAKKRPQYYAGPIEGIGAISNNVKPVLQPPVDTSNFQGGFFLPQPSQDNTDQGQNQTVPTLSDDSFTQQKPTIDQNIAPPNIAQATVPFDITKPIHQSMPPPNIAQATVPFDITKPIHQSMPPPNIAQVTVPFDITKPIHQSMPPPDIAQVTVPFDITKPIHQSMPPPDIAQVTVPFDITKPIETVPNTPFGASQTQQGYGHSSEFNTAFDLSRSGEDRYEPPKQESKGFGLIGSLKSKLSSIDINKIQNSVTTFFDPTYNDTKQEAPAPQYNAPYEPQPNAQYGQYSQQETSNFEIFVPSKNSNQYSQAYGQDQSYSNQSQYAQPNYGQTQNQYYQQQDTFCHQNQDPNAYPSSVYQPYTSHQYFETTTTANVPVSSDVTTWPTAQERLLIGLEDTNTSVPGPITTPSEDIFGKYEHKDEIKEINVTGNVFQVDVSAKNYFDISSDVQNLPANVEKISSDRVLSSADSSQIQYDVADSIVKAPIEYNINENSLETPDSYFTTVTNPTDEKDLDAAFNKFLMEENKIQDVSQPTKDNVQSYATPLDVHSTALLGLSDTSRELSHLEHDSKNVASNDINTAFNRDNNSSFLNVDNPIKEDDKIDLNICQTCREVARPEERELDNLTDQLIENITSPIQLLNPVEVPLTERNPDDESDDFNSSQCNEISHITEETIETIQVQSANELLDDLPLSTAAPGYGWATDGVTFPTENPLVEHCYLPHQTSHLENAYSVPNPNSIGFYASGTASPLDNIPNNASDEIKAEFKFSHEDSPVVLPRQMSIPSAPPAEDDNKSDETGIDVHSIEQDASKDFPFFEEYVIEPSETDDDKIDFKERNTSEEVQEVDSFTNRVERFKKMEESHVDHFDSQRNVGMKLTNTISPSIPLASYFDTGNYAVETHYRNSISSPTIDLSQIRVPPGFEEEYHRRLSGVTQYSVGDNNDITPGTLFMPDTNIPTGYTVSPNFSIALNDVTKGISSVPDTHTQTKHTFSPTFSMAQNDITKGTPYYPDTNTQDAPTFSSLFSIALTSASIISTTAVSKTSDYIPEQSLPGSDDVRGTKTDIVQEITPSISRMFSAPTPDDILAQIPLQIDESEEKADGLADVFAAIDKKGVEFLPPSVFTNIKDLVEETEKESAAIAEISSAFRVEPPMPSLFSFPSKSSEIVGLPKFGDTAAATMTLFPNTEDVAKNMRSTEGFAPDRPKAFAELTISNAPKPPLPNLPDPLNFFATNTEPAQRTDADSGFNRLASYFASPTKTDNTKSFFELSQSQDHYRQEAKPTNIFEAVKASGDSALNAKTNLNLSENKNILKDTVDLSSLPADRYLANINLMNDLTSPQNIGANEQVVRTINYFTVEYDKDNAELSTEYNIGEPETLKKGCVNMNEYRTEVRGKIDDNSLRDVIEHCKHCSDFNFGRVTQCFALDHEVVFDKDYKVKTCMDTNTGDDREREQSTDSVKSNDLNKDCVTVEFGNDPMQQESDEGVATSGENRATSEYTPVKHHWFYGVESEGKSIWRGFSVVDSKALEDAYHSPDLTEQTLVPTDGGRFDVNVMGRLRVPVYWADKPSNVRRCSWFYKGTTDARYVPYTEAVAEKLEEEYRHGVTTGEWHRRLVLPNNELVVMHGPAVMVHFLHSVTDPYSSTPLFVFGKRVYRNPPKIRVLRDQHEAVDHLILLVHGAGEYRYQKEREQSTCRPRVVRRSCDDTEIEDIEPSNIDHLLLLCHGVGSACDMRFRSVEQVALGPDHIVPLASLRFPIITWHMPHCFIRTMVMEDSLLLCQGACLASGLRFRLVRLAVDDFRTTSLQLLQSHYKSSYEKGKVGRIEVLPISWHATLHSGETGVDRRLARITLDSIPRLRNFTNDTVLDVLFYTSPVFCQTIVDTVCAELNRIYALFSRRNPGFGGGVSVGGHSLGSVILYDLLGHQPQEPSPTSCSKKYVSGAGCAGAGAPLVNYPRLDFRPVALYALGSPIAIFECIRGVESLGEDFALPTCGKFFNIFHPYDPIAYRIEPLINPQLRDVKPFLIPHHKGRKRMHLELKETMARVGADIKARLIESIKTTWSSMWKSHPPTDGQLAKVVEEEIEKEGLTEESSKEDQSSQSDLSVTKDMLGKLNSGRRIDYVLQEAPLEMINEYLFAMSSHVCYWESEDTMLLMLREIYDALGVAPDATAPPATMAVPRERMRAEDTTTVVMNVTDHPSTSRGGT